MRGDEQRVQDTFASWLNGQGWSVSTQLEHVDVFAERGGHTLSAEVKGRTAAIGLDVDTAYGQLLRRMTRTESAHRYAIVVPTEALAAALRVPSAVRVALRIDLYEITDDGDVLEH